MNKYNFIVGWMLIICMLLYYFIEYIEYEVLIIVVCGSIGLFNILASMEEV